MTSLKYILLGSAAVATAFAYTAMADHPHKPKKTESSEVETTLKKILGKKSDAKMAAVKSKSDKVDDANGADKKDDEKWDVMNPPGESREIDINVTEGTWMSLDVSPDGKTIAFDMLGDIYTMPITGGKATNIASGMAWEIQPRFSPDGSRIAFTSDRAGGDNIWTMDVDGENKEQVTKESFRLTNNPTWSPDGQFIAARKHFTTSRSLGVGEIWLYHTSGGSGVQLVKKPSDSHQKELGEPMFSPDGQYIYYSQNITPGPIFEYAQDSNTELFQIKRYDMETGEIDTSAGGAGGAVRPAPSPDGKYLAYFKRVRADSRLFIKNLESGEERMIFDHLDQDMQETWGVQGMYPNMDWSPDSSTIYFWANGQIHSVRIKDGDINHIDFEVKDTRKVMIAPRPSVEVAPDEFKTKMTRFTQVSPDGKSVVFESIGKLFLKNIKSGKVSNLTKLPDTMRELYPSWSRDSKQIVFTTWNDTDLAAIHSIDVSSKKITTHTKNPGHYKRPAFSPSGEFITYEKGAGGFLTAPEWSSDTGIYVHDIASGEDLRVSKSGGNPHYADNDMRIFFTKRMDGKATLVSTNVLGGRERAHASSKMAQSYHISPDGQMIAFRENYNLYVMPALKGPQNLAAEKSGNALPVSKVSYGGATYPSWTTDNQLNWTLGPTLFSVDAKDAMADDFEPPRKGLSLSYKVKADKPTKLVLLENARIITMAGEDGGVIEKGNILISGDRIKSIGNEFEIDNPYKNFIRVDLEGKTIVPGFIEAHYHGPQGTDELIPQQNWKTLATLALGVTTVFDPSNRATEIFAAAEMQRAGKLLSPRTYSTGEVVYGAKAPGFFADIQKEEDAQEHIGRLKNQGAHGIKNYNQPRRDQRQQVVKASHDNNILVVSEGGSLYHMDMSLVQDGNSSVEHNLPVSAIYDDVVQMFAQTNVANTPTLSVTYGGIRGEDYYYQESDVWKHPILSKHVPPAVLQARAVRRQMAPEEDYADADAGAVSKKLMEAGVMVSIGGHGQREGLASHWEMWSFSRGGMSPLQTLRTATTEPARHLGFDKDIGTLEKGKLADLVILSDNPLDDIRNTDKVEHVMLGGRLYEAETMNEVHTGNAKRLTYWWE